MTPLGLNPEGQKRKSRRTYRKVLTNDCSQKLNENCVRAGFYFHVDWGLVLKCHRNGELFRWKVTSAGLLVQYIKCSWARCLVGSVDRCDSAEEAATSFLVWFVPLGSTEAEKTTRQLQEHIWKEHDWSSLAGFLY